jgi:hypothetical protein
MGRHFSRNMLDFCKPNLTTPRPSSPLPMLWRHDMGLLLWCACERVLCLLCLLRTLQSSYARHAASSEQVWGCLTMAEGMGRIV